MFYLGKTSRERLEGVNPNAIRVIERALTISKVDFGIPAMGGLRTAEEQNQLYKDGLSQLDGYRKRSYHQTGDAFDVFAYVDGKASWDETHLLHVATAIFAAASQLGYKIEWGGHWRNFTDMPHFQMV